MSAPQRRTDRATGVADTQFDADDMAPALAVGVVSGAQARGVVAYGAIGLFAGLLVGALVALIPMGDWSYFARLALFGGVGALGGLVAGAVFGGGHEPEREGEIDVALDLREDTDAPTAKIPPRPDEIQARAKAAQDIPIDRRSS